MKINYPTKKLYKKTVSTSNRGMNLEEDLNQSNDHYLINNTAIIYKKPVPIQIVKVDYPSRSAAVIKEAYFKVPSTTDYNGIYKGKYIDFEAKETKNKTSFPLNNIHKHQVEHLNNISKMGGIGFVIVRFTTLDLTFYLESDKLFEFYNRGDSGGRKSISLDEFKEYGHLIKNTYSPRIDYLKIVDLYIE